MNIIIFFTGLSTLFFLPSLFGLTAGDFFYTISFFIFLGFLSIKKIFFTKKELSIIFLFLIFYFASLIGGYFTGYLYSFVTSTKILMWTFVMICSLKRNFYKQFSTGIFYSAYITSIFVLLDTFTFYCLNLHKPLIQIILPSFLLGTKPDFLHYEWFFNKLLYRPSGFSWDPGINITGVSFIYILLDLGFLQVEQKKRYKIIILAGIIASTSKTSILAVLVYYILKLYSKIIPFIKEARFLKWGVPFFIEILSFFVVGLLIDYHGLPYERHLKYFSSIIYTFNSDIGHFIFGYGPTSPGTFFDKYVPWLIGGDFKVEGTAAECTLINIFLFGGLLGSLYWIYGCFLILKTKNKKYTIPLLILAILSFGYSISDIWFYILVVLLFLLSSNFERYKHGCINYYCEL